MPQTTVIIRPTAQGTFSTYTLFAGPSKPAAVSDASDSTSLLVGGTAFDNETFQMADIASPGGSLVSSVKWFGRFQVDNIAPNEGFINPRPVLYLNGIELTGTTFSLTGAGSPQATFSEVFTTKPGGGAWTIFDVNALELGCDANYGGSGYVRSLVLDLWAEITYNPNPLYLEQVRKILTSRLMLRHGPRGLIQVTGPMILGDHKPQDLLTWSHPDGPEDTGLGWGEKEWLRKQSRLLRSTFNPNNNTFLLECEDWRPHLFLLYDEGRSRTTISSYANGVARYYVGVRTFNRDSKAWIEDPSDDGSVRELSYDIEKLSGGTFAGQLLERASTNLLLRSCFVSGTTGLTLSGTGTNGSAIAVDTTDLLFTSSITPNSLKWTAGNPHAADLFAAWPATSTITANTVVTFSCYHKDDSGATLYWRLQRAVDSRYWNDTAGTWDVGVVNNAFANSTSRVRHLSKAINVGGTNTTMTLSIGQLSGGTASRVNRVYHVQLEALPWASSVIVTDAATVTRAVETLYYANNTGARNIHVTRGTMAMEVIPLWTAANVSGYTFVLWSVTYDANNWLNVRYDGTSGTLIFSHRSGGVTTTTSVAWSPVRGTSAKIVARWVSSLGEYGLSPYTISIFVNGTKGTDAVPAGNPNEVGTIDLHFGSDTGVNNFDGVIRRTISSQLAYSDVEIGRGLPLR